MGRTVIGLWDKLLNRTPVVRSIYKGSKQIFETIFAQKGASFRYVCLVEWPRRDCWSIAFVSREVDGGQVGLEPGRDMYAIYVSTTPNPTSGYLFFVDVGGCEDPRHERGRWIEAGDFDGPRLPRPAAARGGGGKGRCGQDGASEAEGCQPAEISLTASSRSNR